MLDFLRRKDKRKPQDAAAAAAAASAVVAAHPSAAAAVAQSRKPATDKPSVLRDRNATPAVSSGARRANTQHRPAPAASKHNIRMKTDKENASNVANSQKIDHVGDVHIESTYRRWGKRQGAPTSPQQAAQPALNQSGSTEKKRKNRRQRVAKHEAAVHTKSVTTDRRRSVKVAVSPVTQPAPKRRTSRGAQASNGVEQFVEQGGLKSKASRTSASRPSGTDRPGHQRNPSNAGSSSGKVEYSQSAQLTWPHVDLAAVLRAGDIAAADIPIRRIAAAAARDNATRLKMIREGVAPSIVTLLRHKDTTLEMRRLATFAIAELAVLEECEDDLVAADCVIVLIKLISLGNDCDRSTLGSACRALRNLLGGKESTAIQAARYGCVEPLLAIVDGRFGRGEEPEVLVEAAAAISNLSNHGTRFQSYVIKHGGLGALTTLGMKTENEEAMFHVVNVLAEFAREVRWHKAIVAADGLLTAFRALRLANDPEVVAEASRLIGNVAVTHKARSAVREAGGLAALVDRLNRCKSFKDMVPAFDIVRALANVSVDGRAAAEALSHKDAASVLLRVYTAQDAREKLVKTSFRALQVLAHGSATRRAKVLYAVGNQVKQAGLAGLPVKRLYDIRQAILEDIETGDREASAAMPESLERLSRASVRLINSGVVSHVGNNLQISARGTGNRGAGEALSPKVQRVPSAYASARGQRINDTQRPGMPGFPMNAENFARKSNPGMNKFRSTGRVVSVTRNCKPGHQPVASRRPTEGRGAFEEDDCDVLPRGNEEALASDSDLRSRLLAQEADGNMVQDFFELGQVLGKGGYGSVFLAKDIRTGDLVAIKRFHNSGALVDKKAVKEQNIWKGLHHDNVVEFKGSFVGDNGSLNLVVEYVDGLSLAEHLSQYSAFPETLVAEIARQVLNGLEYLHRNGVTHRDLKPANILVDNSATVKICDFGVSRSENVQTINPGQQHMVGTPWYIAPEMVEYRPYTTSVDIWSLGCTVLELATGRRPYHELSAMQVLFRMVEDRRPPIPNYLSPEAKDFLKACWVWDPQERPSATDLLRHPFTLKARKFSDSSKQSSLASASDNADVRTS